LATRIVDHVRRVLVAALIAVALGAIPRAI
jgi:hypothetical protein